ncbi:hypothetical protein [Nocardia sp. 852002-51101_SCH5132738]|uniref:hypothetical protein n=1 Tax=Nocardia sp. 852002-51101_SCH5132738 TaxID=1834095 RepID=UPI000AB82062|nr:hypothetical protein [Nocardia sp. 852002-51101_SCH5132738]
MAALNECPNCRVELDDHGNEVSCWKCGWSVRAVDDPIGYFRRSDDIKDARLFHERLRR